MGVDYDFTLLLLVFMRMSGCIMFNPILGRKNVPAILKIGLTLMLSIFTYKLVPAQTLQISSFIVLFVFLLKEFFIGYMVGFVIQMFLSIMPIAGESMDMQIGISMSKIYDPQSNISMALSASFANAMFILIFFAVNGHLTLIQIFIKLCVMVPYGSMHFEPAMFQELYGMISLIVIYAIKMSLPVLAAELITEIAVGLIMRAVPQIDVFSLNIQLKVVIGFIMIILIVSPLASFIEKLITLMFDNVNHIFQMLL